MKQVLMAALLLAACSEGGGSPADGGGGAGGGSGGGGEGGHVTGCEGADLETDPQNCGACGRTCVIPAGDAACVAGECALGSCATGFADCDADVDNGCEHPIACDEGDACPTSCNSTGALSCADVCAPACANPAEACNAIDDDCDGVCDNGPVAGCRDGVLRASGAKGHFYGLEESEATGQGYTIEALDYFFLYTGAAADLRPLFRCVKANGAMVLTTDTACETLGYVQATVGFIAPVEECGAIPLYRLHHAASDNHFYTTSAGERDNAITAYGYVDQGIAGYVWPNL
jgi:hypothetical protein